MFLKIIFLIFLLPCGQLKIEYVQIVAGSSKDLAILKSRMPYLISLPKTIDKTLLRAEVGSYSFYAEVFNNLRPLDLSQVLRFCTLSFRFKELLRIEFSLTCG
jgi:hypothetical protein